MTNEVKAEQPAKAAKPPRPRRQQDGAKRLFLFFAALSGHGLLNAEQAAEYFDKAHRYQIVHTLALLALVALPTHWPTRLCRTAGFLWLFGLFAFCGSLYAMVFIAGWNLRPLVPAGGIAFLLGWAMLFFAACWGETHGR